MPSGILIIDKPAGWTSMDVCAKVRGIFHEKRVGHGGIAGPHGHRGAAGLCGAGHPRVEFAENGQKEYVAGLRLGQVTDTQESPAPRWRPVPSRRIGQHWKRCCPAFWESRTRSPMYSAVKVGGQKLYDLARKGQVVERKPRRHHHLRAGATGPGEPVDYLLRCRCPRAPTSAPSAMTSADSWAAAGRCTPSAAPWRKPASGWSRQ